jgi:hypothetical protein
VGNIENQYLIPNPNKTSLKMFIKQFSKRKSIMNILRYLWRSYKGWLNRIYRMNLSKTNTPQIKKS